MHKTYNDRRVYDREDISKAADIMRQVLESADENVARKYGKKVNAAVKMLTDIAAGMGWDDGIVCDDFTTIEHDV